MVVSSVDIKKNIILVILDFHSKINDYQSKYQFSSKQAIEILSVANEINKIVDALDLGQALKSKGLKLPRISDNEYEKLKRVLDLTFRYRTDLNAVAMDIGEKLAYSNQLLQAGIDYIFRNLQDKKFEKIAQEEFSKKDTTVKNITKKIKRPSQTNKKQTGFLAQLLFIVILGGGGYYLYNSIFNKHATQVSSLVKEYRSDKKLSETSRPVTTKVIKVSGSPYIVGAISKWKNNFLATYKDLSVEMENIDSGIAIEKLLDGEINIAATSRIPNLNERRKSQKLGRLLADHKVAMDAVAIFVNPSNPIKELSVDDLKEIYSDDDDEWQKFGGAKTKITKYSPSPQSGTFDFFRDRVMFHEDYDEGVIKMIDVNQMVQLIEKDHSGIGFASVSNLVGRKVKILAVTTFLNEDRGVSPLQNGEINKPVIKNGEYPLTRYLYLITSGELDDSAAKFIDYFRSEEGQRALDSVGLVSIY